MPEDMNLEFRGQTMYINKGVIIIKLAFNAWEKIRSPGRSYRKKDLSVKIKILWVTAQVWKDQKTVAVTIVTLRNM